ncbi:hypothetical protein NKH10_22705 [Mesorhizobium sp. M1340]|uniref:hypothetical protein n=1 Tax=unclassified Mesorhizobium TaxID=325217 RepID=UPI00333B24F3
MAVDAPVGKDVDQIEAVIDESRFVRFAAVGARDLANAEILRANGKLVFQHPEADGRRERSSGVLFSGWPE